jgi:hypothetical protein
MNPTFIASNNLAEKSIFVVGTPVQKLLTNVQT